MEKRKLSDMEISDINITIMNFIGLETRNNNIIYDEDTGNAIKFRDKQLILADTNAYIEPGTSLFNPLYNIKLCIELLSYMYNKLQQEDSSLTDIILFYNIPVEDNKGYYEIRFHNNTIMQSNKYYNDTLKIIDLIYKLNHHNVDLSYYDIPREV